LPLRWIGTGPLPHPATQRQDHMGGRVGERAGTVTRAEARQRR